MRKSLSACLECKNQKLRQKTVFFEKGLMQKTAKNTLFRVFPGTPPKVPFLAHFRGFPGKTLF